MLITFHYFGILLYEILKNRKRLKNMIANPSTTVAADQETQLKFHPPVFKQRLYKVYQTLINEKWRNDLKKLVDFGCAEFDLFMYLKNLNIEEIMFVDIDETALRENLGKLEPLLADRLRRRNQPLDVFVFRGSAVDPDYRLCKTDVVTAIELIEHLYPDTLEALPYNIFAFIKPKLVIITTPNADFNVVFQREGLRHPDHKFEWTRQQFEDWATNITEQFTDYIVEFTGIAKLLNQPENIGHCTQGAIFIRKDLLNEKYISPVYARKCQCDNSSPCKGQTTECKLLCNCVCVLCLPDFSVGICKYLSRNIKESEAYRPMKTWPKLSATSSDIESKLELYSNVDDCGDGVMNPSYNIFYKFIMKIDYPYEVDLRSENERLLDMFKYRIDTFSSFNNRFYNEKTGQCEIPLIDIMYGDICISIEEIRHLLCEAGYKLEECITPQTGESELCIVSTPHEMDNIESTSEDTEEYPNNSLSDEASNIDPGTLSDWDEVPRKSSLDVGPSSSTVQPKPNPDPLFDSGYLNSPSPVDGWSREEADDQFEEATSSFSIGDKKLPQRLPIIMTTTNYRKIQDPRRNELDHYHNIAAEYKAHHRLEEQEPIAVAGPSCSPSKSKKLKSKEVTVLDDAKSLANIILQNSLNIIDEDDDVVPEAPLEIMDLLQEQELPEVVVEAAIEAMENGDLANNNRDNEGNNLEHNQAEELWEEVDEGIDLLNDNLEEIVVAPLVEDNANFPENNNDVQVVEELLVAAGIVENEAAPINELEGSESLGEASKEALFDENSEQDLLEDFDDMMPNDDSVCDRILQTFGTGITLNSIRPLIEPESPASLEHDFPDWLLHILGNHVPAEVFDDGNETSRFASHCFCQGDGLDPYLGVRPSTLAVDEADNESENSDTLSNDSRDFAEINPRPSDMFETSLAGSDEDESLEEDYRNYAITRNTEVFIDEIIQLAQEQVFARLAANNDTQCDSASSSSDPGQLNAPITPHNSSDQNDAGYSVPPIGSLSSWIDQKPKVEDQDQEVDEKDF